MYLESRIIYYKINCFLTITIFLQNINNKHYKDNNLQHVEGKILFYFLNKHRSFIGF